MKSRRRASCSGEPNVLSSVISSSVGVLIALRLAAERGHLDEHVLKDDVHETEAAADDAAVAEEAPDLSRMRVRGDVEILRRSLHQQIAHAAAAQVRAVAAAMQPVENLENVLRNAPPRNGMVAAVDDDAGVVGGHVLWGRGLRRSIDHQLRSPVPHPRSWTFAGLALGRQARREMVFAVDDEERPFPSRFREEVDGHAEPTL